MRILLIDPPYKSFTGFANYYYPMGLASIAACIRKAGHEADVLDADAVFKGYDINFNEEYKRLELYRNGINDNYHEVWRILKKIISEYKPDIAGITVMTTKLASALKTAEIIKGINRQMPVLAGGPHASLDPGQLLDTGYVDIVIRGEGEDTIRELLTVFKYRIKESDLLNDNYPVKYDQEALKKINGISYNIKSKTIHNPDRELIKSLDDLPLPARNSLMFAGKYSSEDMGAIMCSRGCPFNCAYCCHPWGRQVRYRSVENVLTEIKEVIDIYKTKQFEFKDDSFNVNKKWVLEFCGRIIKDKIRINWGCTTRVDTLNDEILREMKKAGCNIVKIGIETGSEKILEETNKGINFQQIISTAKLLNKHKIFWSGYFMVGLPNETREDIIKTCDFIRKINPYYAGLGVYNPFPGTALFDKGVEMGLLNPGVAVDHFFKTNPKDYYFIDPGVRLKNMNKDEFNEILDVMMKRFHKHNTQAKNLIRRAWARRMTYLSDRKIFIRDFSKAVKWICT